jgi:hypothetical protein
MSITTDSVDIPTPDISVAPKLSFFAEHKIYFKTAGIIFGILALAAVITVLSLYFTHQGIFAKSSSNNTVNSNQPVAQTNAPNSVAVATAPLPTALQAQPVQIGSGYSSSCTTMTYNPMHNGSNGSTNVSGPIVQFVLPPQTVLSLWVTQNGSDQPRVFTNSDERNSQTYTCTDLGNIVYDHGVVSSLNGVPIVINNVTPTKH